MTMSFATGFATAPVDQGFACRSARYLADHGFSTSQIRMALVEQLELDQSAANLIVEQLAA